MNQYTMISKPLEQLLLSIPKGKVVTYKTLAQILHIHPRSVASQLRKNSYQDTIPCYRVIHSDYTIGGYNLGVNEKIRRLQSDGILISHGKIDKQQVITQDFLLAKVVAS